MVKLDIVDEVPYGSDVELLEIKPMDEMEAAACIEKRDNWERYRQFWLDYYAKKVDEVNQKCDRNIAFQDRKLRDYFMTVPHRSTDTMEACDLPNGRLSMSFIKKKLVPDREAIISRLKEVGEMEYIKTKVKEELDWSGYKSRLFISENGDVLDKETGEVIEDVSVEVSEPKFSVKSNQEKESDEE